MPGRALDGTAATVAGSSRDVDPGWRYDLAVTPSALLECVRQAVGDIGRREDPDGSNDGPQLARYRTGGLPWCAYALSYWLSFADGGCPWGRLGSAYKIHRWARDLDRILPDAAALRPGDVAIDLRRVVHDGRPSISGHVALVVYALDPARICTVGGNEANRVRGRVRERAAFRFYARPFPQCA